MRNQVDPFVIHPVAQDEEKPLLSMVVPTYNESQNIEAVVHDLVKILDRRIPGKYEIMVVDDDSPDGTWGVVETMRARYPQLHLLRRIGERGLSSAVVRGWQSSRGSLLGVIDGDLQHPPATVLELLEAIVMDSGVDLAVASRHVKGGGVSEWNVFRRLLSRGAQVLGLILLPDVVRLISDPLSGYFLVRRECVAGRVFKPIGYKILLEVIAKGDIRKIMEVGFVFQERGVGASKIGIKECWDYIRQIIHLRLHLFRRGRRKVVRL